MSEGKKYDSEKILLGLVDPYYVEDMARVMTFGARKYTAENWRGGISYDRIINSLGRHFLEIQKGIDLDPETGLPHVAHIGCNAMFLHFYGRTMPHLDNRWYAQPKKGITLNIPVNTSKSGLTEFESPDESILVDAWAKGNKRV